MNGEKIIVEMNNEYFDPVDNEDAPPAPRPPEVEPKSIKVTEQRARALELRSAGCSYRLIAERMGVSLGQAHKLVRGGMRAAQARIDRLGNQLAALEYERLEAPVANLVMLLKSGKLDPAELCQVIETIRRLSESRRKLRGLDLATRAGDGADRSVNVSVQVNEDKRRSKLIELREALASVPGASEALAAYLATQTKAIEAGHKECGGRENASGNPPIYIAYKPDVTPNDADT